MHNDEVAIDARMVQTLVATQFPQWASLDVVPVASAGTDNALFRLGSDLVVRLPRVPSAVGQVAKESRWLPFLAPRLPLPIPLPVAIGSPANGYPWHWSICHWLEGETAADAPVADEHQAATDLAGFIVALQSIDPAGGPDPGVHNSHRGAPLVQRDASTRAAIAECAGMIDAGAAMAAWECALAAPEWRGPPVWIHGDLLPTNLLVQHGGLSAVIDFGCLGIGDPGCDVIPAWTFLSAQSRLAFRAALKVDDATWERGRGWALSFGLIALPYYHVTNPVLAGIACRAIAEVLADAVPRPPGAN